MVKRNRKQQMANALSAQTNLTAIPEKIVAAEEEPKMVSLRIPAELYKKITDYQYSSENSAHLNRSKIIVKAIEEFFKDR